MASHDISHRLTTFYATMPSPVGSLLLTASPDGLTGIYLPGERSEPDPDWELDPFRFADCMAQLGEYFAGDRIEFSLPLAAPGTPFQHQVWDELTRIGYGTTITYTELAERVGRPTAHRAVGAANGRNPICIVVACHRVVGVDGSLTGYSAGIESKRWLLDFERGARPSGQAHEAAGVGQDLA
jgi:methylated-DNA-[protein]-cysteine S-methyltransferase